MKTKYNLKLIDGVFGPYEEAGILLHLIENKIKYHNHEIFSYHERYGKKLVSSYKRIKDLKKEQKKLKQILSLASKKEMLLQVKSVVKISLTKKRKSHGKETKIQARRRHI